MHRRLLLALSLLLLMAGPVLADAAPVIPTGVTLQPSAETQVQMAWERIEIAIKSDPEQPPSFLPQLIQEVNVHFHFVPAKDESVQAGFPLEWHDQTHPFASGIHQFFVEIDGKQVAYTSRQVEWDGSTKQWAVWPLSFQSGTPVDLIISYRAPFNATGKGSTSPHALTYILRTGAFWAGPIGRIDAVVSAEKGLGVADVWVSGATGGTTPGWQVVDGKLVWHWEKVEPTFDLDLYLLDPHVRLADQEVERLLSLPTRTDAQWKLLVQGMRFLLDGGRMGESFPIRPGVDSFKAGMAVLPRFLGLLDERMKADPSNKELVITRLAVLQAAAIDSSWDPTLDGWANRMRDQAWFDRFFEALATAPSDYRLVGLVPLANKGSLSDDQFRLVERLALAQMPKEFVSQAEARDWMQNQLDVAISESPTQGRLTANLWKVAVQRVVVPAPPNPPPVAASAPVPAPLAPLTRSSVGWLPWLIGLGLIAGGGALARWWRQRPR